MLKIFIDEGHNFSGADTGATGYGLREQDITHLVGMKLGKLFEAIGLEVKHSRPTLSTNLGTGSVASSVAARYTMANDWDAALFISLHTDATASCLPKGAHVCVYSKKTGVVSNSVAEKIINELLRIGLEGRSVLVQERKDLSVLENTKMPAVLVEMGFITNEHNSTMLRDNPDKIAQAIFNGVCECYNITSSKPVEYPTPAEAIAILAKRGIIVEPDKWYAGTWTDADFKWLLRKVGAYLNGD